MKNSTVFSFHVVGWSVVERGRTGATKFFISPFFWKLSSYACVDGVGRRGNKALTSVDFSCLWKAAAQREIAAGGIPGSVDAKTGAAVGHVTNYLSLRLDRPLQGCQLRPRVYVYSKLVTTTGVANKAYSNTDHRFLYTWSRGPERQVSARKGEGSRGVVFLCSGWKKRGSDEVDLFILWPPLEFAFFLAWVRSLFLFYWLLFIFVKKRVCFWRFSFENIYSITTVSCVDSLNCT